MVSFSPLPEFSSLEMESSNLQPKGGMEYLVELIDDKKNLQMFPKLFRHVDRLVDQEIAQVRSSLFQFNFAKTGLDLPDPIGEPIIVREKVYIPVDEYPDFNFVGRILGPRGMTAKQLEQETGCKIMIRGKGSVRDRSREAARRGKTEQEDNLHVLIQCEDAPNRARRRVDLAVKHVSKLLVPMQEGSDELKRKQLMELSLINGTYKPLRSPRVRSSNTETRESFLDMDSAIDSPQNSPFLKSPAPFKLQAPPKGRSSVTSEKSWISSSPPTDSSFHINDSDHSTSPEPSSGNSILRAYMPGYFPPSPVLLEDSQSFILV
ncbi:unnamed protein product [Bursaphelenchus okinawaensis]|uniref:K Homology domain-containing protein n=1 Tax=Bursaphelenchus okinawaensis TaxID=465554 RepID=A0A811JT35_9BILA|nr:unnamed protein product [Bursaphelenchus okinawaensis]CAG9081726.1 unnamed protein product [Bursaphelenchus okinawaensis]